LEISRPADQVCAVAGVQLQQTPHLEQGLVLGQPVAVKEVDQHLQDVQEGLEVARGFLSLKLQP
jgi:hypothetical protein